MKKARPPAGVEWEPPAVLEQDTEAAIWTASFRFGVLRVTIDKLDKDASESLALRESMRKLLPRAYPAYETKPVFERPLLDGICVEAKLEPRQGSQLPPLCFYALQLPHNLVLVEHRRPETNADDDIAVRRFVHGIRPTRRSKKFALEKRLESVNSRIDERQYQTFLCHNSQDKPHVRELYRQLLEMGVVSWFDEQNIASGERFIPEIENALAEVDAIVVCVGPGGLGGWQELEYGAAVNAYVRRKRAGGRALRVVPVTLPEGPPLDTFPALLATFQGHDLRNGITRTAVTRLAEALLPGGGGKAARGAGSGV